MTDVRGERTEKKTARAARAEADVERRRRRAQFLRELAEARALQERVAPHRAKVERLRRIVRMRAIRT